MAQEIERDTLETDILIIGAGPAGLSLAYHLTTLCEQRGVVRPEIFLMEKGKYAGAHSLSGAVMDPRGIAELIPDFISKGAPLEAPCGSDSFYILTENSAIKVPILPPPLQNHGNYIISLNKFTAWLADQVRARGIDIYEGLAGFELLIEEGSVAGVQTVDLGLNKDGTPGHKFEPGSIIKAKLTILCEGVHGSLTRMAFEKIPALKAGKLPQQYLTGVKEVWEVPSGRIKAGDVIHTVGFPQPSREYGGAWLYAMTDTMVSVGHCVGLDSTDPMNDPHGRFQRYKTHKLIRSILDGGKMLHYGAKAIPVAGYFAMPRLWHDGLLLAGDSAGFLNASRLKGIHLAIKSGMMAAETVINAVAADRYDGTILSQYETLFESSWAKTELYGSRNFHAGFRDGLISGLLNAGIQTVTRGGGLFERREHGIDSSHMLTVAEYERRYGRKPSKTPMTFDNSYLFDKVTDVYKSGTMHEEHEPSHLLVADYNICNTRCTEEYGNPCQHFCPASVYNMVPDESRPGKTKLQLTPSNCVHCKTCDIADPYQIIRWVVPQGGEGPNYTNL